MTSPLKDIKDICLTDKDAYEDPRIKIKPLKHVRIVLKSNLCYNRGRFEAKSPIVKRCRAQHIKWASLEYKINLEDSFRTWNSLYQVTSLRLTSIVVTDRQVGACVGHFFGSFDLLAKRSRHLQKLHFATAVVQKRRCLGLRRWLLQQCHLTHLAFVPYWLKVVRGKSFEDLYDYGNQFIKTLWLTDLPYLLGAHLNTLHLIGILNNNTIKALDFTKMNSLHSFLFTAASRPYDVDGEYFKFGDAEIRLLEKVVQSKSLETITLLNDADETRGNFWKKASLVFARVQRPLTFVVVLHDVDWGAETLQHFKRFVSYLTHNKSPVKFGCHLADYSLSLPEGIQVKTDNPHLDYYNQKEEEQLGQNNNNDDYDDSEEEDIRQNIEVEDWDNDEEPDPTIEYKATI